MSLTNDPYEVHKRRIRISVGMNFNGCTDVKKLSAHKKHKNAIDFECERRDVV